MKKYISYPKIKYLWANPTVDAIYSSVKLNKIALDNKTCSVINNQPILFSHGRRIEKFFTEDSRLYITPQEQKLLDQGIKLDRSIRKWDSLSSKIVREYKTYKKKRNVNFTSDILVEKFDLYRRQILENVREKSRVFTSGWTISQVWNFSIVGAILLGMISMTLIYKFLGPEARARDTIISSGQSSLGDTIENPSQVLGIETIKESNKELDAKNTDQTVNESKNNKKQDLENKIRAMVKGYPIEEMLPYILEKDEKVAAFLVAIAKKESNWGVHVPLLNGKDCYNYWGYKGKRKLMGTGGHTCFNSRQDAVDTVAKRLDKLVNEDKLDTPKELVIWKCGSACQKDDQSSVKKWISDVSLYYNKLQGQN